MSPYSANTFRNSLFPVYLEQKFLVLTKRFTATAIATIDSQ
ncbi:MAG: hypothetical protein AAGJ08_22640 [Cyanobacteria bacterium P01_H01_bin.35]